MINKNKNISPFKNKCTRKGPKKKKEKKKKKKKNYGKKKKKNSLFSLFIDFY